MKTLSIEEIRKILPQAYPVLMVDKVTEYEEGKRLTAIKNISENEWSAYGTICEPKKFPETLIIEAAAQTALILYHLCKNSSWQRQLRYLLGKISGEFMGVVSIGDQLRIEALGNKMLDDGGYSDVCIYVESQKIAEVTIVYSVEEK